MKRYETMIDENDIDIVQGTYEGYIHNEHSKCKSKYVRNRLVSEYEPEVDTYKEFEDQNKLPKIFEYISQDTNIIVHNDVYSLDAELLEEYDDNKMYTPYDEETEE